MTNLKKITASVLALIMIISLAACGGNSIVGKWNYELPVKGFVENTVKNSTSDDDAIRQAGHIALLPIKKRQKRH